MNIRIVSTLTPDDERLTAPVILNAVTRVLEQLPIAYMVRLESADAGIYRDNRSHDIELAHITPAETSSGHVLFES